MQRLSALVLPLLLIAAPAHPEGDAPVPIANFHEVTSGVYRGARPENAEAVGFLVNQKEIRTVIDLQGGDDKSPLTGKRYPGTGALIDYLEKGESDADITAERRMIMSHPGVAFISEPLNSLRKVTPAEAERIREILGIMNDPGKQPVYLHCAHGADRTGLVVALYRYQYQHWTAEAAYQEMLKDGHTPLHQVFTSPMDRDFFEVVIRTAILERSGERTSPDVLGGPDCRKGIGSGQPLSERLRNTVKQLKDGVLK